MRLSKFIVFFLLAIVLFTSCDSSKSKEYETTDIDEDTKVVKNGNGKIDVINTGEEFATKEGESLHQKGLDAAMSGNYEEALGYFESSLELEPENVTILNSLGNVNRLMKHPDKSISYLEKAININSEYMASYLNSILAYSDLKEYDLAEESFNYVLQHSEDPVDIGAAYYNIAVCSFFKGDCGLAQKRADKALEYLTSVEMINSINAFQVYMNQNCK